MTVRGKDTFVHACSYISYMHGVECTAISTQMYRHCPHNSTMEKDGICQENVCVRTTLPSHFIYNVMASDVYMCLL